MGKQTQNGLLQYIVIRAVIKNFVQDDIEARKKEAIGGVRKDFIEDESFK